MLDDLRIIVYGNSGIGKTEFFGSGYDDPRVAPMLWLDLEGGAKTIRSKIRPLESLSQLGNPEKGKIDYYRIRDFKDLQAAYDFLLGVKSRDRRASYNSVVIDSLTEVNNLGLNYVMGTSPVPKLEPDVAEQRDYLKINQMMKTMLRGFRDIEGLHVLMSCLPQLKAEENSSLAQIKPALIGKLADEAMAIVDYVGYLKPGKVPGTRQLIFQPEGRVCAKERSERNRQIGELKDPTLSMLLDEIFKEKTTP